MQFDLNPAILRWRETLAQSPQFRSGDLAELESHLGDAVAQLQGRELSEEEAFLIATRLCFGLKSELYLLPLLALAYCAFVWLRKTESRVSWMGFFAGEHVQCLDLTNGRYWALTVSDDCGVRAGCGAQAGHRSVAESPRKSAAQSRAGGRRSRAGVMAAGDGGEKLG